jgi:hypothetical protein
MEADSEMDFAMRAYARQYVKMSTFCMKPCGIYNDLTTKTPSKR